MNIEAAVRKLEHQIHYHNNRVAAEAAEEAKKNSWTTWLLSPLYKKRKETEKEQEAKSRKSQERRIERDMKERVLLSKNVELSNEQGRLEKAKQEFVDANRGDDHNIWKIEATLKVRQARERQEEDRFERERDRVGRLDRERKARIHKEELYKQEEQDAKKRQGMARRQREETRVTCIHNNRWPEVQGRTGCPECGGFYTHLLQCSICNVMACPKCQRELRWQGKRPRPRARSPSPTPPDIDDDS